MLLLTCCAKIHTDLEQSIFDGIGWWFSLKCSAAGLGKTLRCFLHLLFRAVIFNIAQVQRMERLHVHTHTDYNRWMRGLRECAEFIGKYYYIRLVKFSSAFGRTVRENRHTHELHMHGRKSNFGIKWQLSTVLDERAFRSSPTKQSVRKTSNKPPASAK